MKRILLLAAAAFGLAALKKMQDTRAERDLWAEATDDATGL
ncbi:MAG: DLW-39 family protein [Ornithinimicrobium sp.]|nr:DLW-39 family protein [Ornithinimicrobium sp.]MDO5739178.1 DLW-39 family protein [Ornithinimicrobium sp.]